MTRWGSVALAVLMPVVVLAPTAGVAQAAGDGCRNPRITVLKTLKSDPTGTVEDINASGLAVGLSGRQPVYWTKTRVHRVPLPAGFGGGQVSAVNRDGLMVGWFTDAADSSHRTPFSYQAGASAAILLPTGGVSGWADDVDDSGRIAGTVAGADRGVVWRDGQLLATLPLAEGQSIEEVTSINSAGSVVAHGTIWNYNNEDYLNVVFLWGSVDAPPTVLGPTVGPSLQDWEHPALADDGQVVGSLLSSAEDAAVHWDPPGYGDAGEVASLPGFNSDRFTAISPDTHLAAGFADTRDGTGPEEQALVWPGSGPALALPRLAGDRASHAYAASDSGSVGGDAVDAAGSVKPVVWKCALKQAYPPGG